MQPEETAAVDTSEMEQSTARKKAVALKYDPAEDAVPVIAALGQGLIAENIIRIAEENDVPIKQDEAIADVLSKYSVGDSIPPALYEAVAQILVFVLSTDELAKKTGAAPAGAGAE